MRFGVKAANTLVTAGKSAASLPKEGCLPELHAVIMEHMFRALLLTAGFGFVSAARAKSPRLDRESRQMYTLHFDNAHRTLGEWKTLHPDDQRGPASDAAAYLFTEFDRLHILQSEFFTHD